MKIVTLDDITLINSSIPADFHQGAAVPGGKWAAAGSYGTGDQVYYDGVFPHLVYTSLVDSNTSIPGTDATKWTNNGATDRCLMFDQFMETQSLYDEEFWVEIDASNTNYMGLFRLIAKEVTLTLFKNTQLLTNGDCSSDSFSKGIGWTHDAVDGEYDCSGAQVTTSGLYQDSITTEDIKYLVKFTIKNYAAGTIAGLAGGTTGTAVSADGDYTQVITAGASGHAGVTADENFIGSVTDISVQMVPKSETVNLDGSLIFDWYSYFFAEQEYKETLTWEYPQYSESTIRVSITWKADDSAKAGILAIGHSNEIGGTLYDPDLGILDFSKKDTDPDFGYTYLKQGSYADDGRFKVWILNTRIDAIKRLLVANRGVPTILDFNNAGLSYESFIYYCFIGQNRISIPGPIRSRLSIDATGLI